MFIERVDVKREKESGKRGYKRRLWQHCPYSWKGQSHSHREHCRGARVFSRRRKWISQTGTPHFITQPYLMPFHSMSHYYRSWKSSHPRRHVKRESWMNVKGLAESLSTSGPRPMGRLSWVYRQFLACVSPCDSSNFRVYVRPNIGLRIYTLGRVKWNVETF